MDTSITRVIVEVVGVSETARKDDGTARRLTF